MQHGRCGSGSIYVRPLMATEVAQPADVTGTFNREVAGADLIVARNHKVGHIGSPDRERLARSQPDLSEVRVPRSPDESDSPNPRSSRLMNGVGSRLESFIP